jgi:Fe-Mn family superoxide dismutase
LRNNGGGWWNHNFFFEALCNPKNSKISDEFKSLLSRNFGSYEKFVEEFSNAAATQFGSGWAWLGKKKNGSLEIYPTSNQDNCFMDVNNIKSVPILTLDVWEHAYYLKYQNRRPEYIKNFFKVVYWSVVEDRYNK